MSLKSEVEKLPGYNAVVRPWHFVQAWVAGAKNGWPAKKLKVIAVTGTNGKTSTCFFVWKMLTEAGYKTGLLTTVGWNDGRDFHAQVEHMTTERVEVLNERMKKIRENGAEYLVLETTSHALMQSRLLGVPVEVGVFTNLTHEHLDYHKTFEKYGKAKARLFRKARKAVLNADDLSSEVMKNEYITKGINSGKRSDEYTSDDIIMYGIQQGDLRATDVKLLSGGVEYTCGGLKIKTKIPGRFNVYNSLAAIGVGRMLGFGDKEIQKGIQALDEVEGRMTRVDEGQDYTVIVDYAHTPDAIENVLDSVSCFDADHFEGRIIVVHGGAGRRDASTRAERGEILGKKADIVIITEDDSRDEDPMKIAESFAEGAEKAGKKRNEDLFIEIDREKAIRKAFDEAKKGDIVLILGKGHEKTILRADGAHDFEDIKIAKKILREK